MCPLLLLIVAQVNKPQTQISLLLFPWSHLQSKLNTRVYLLHILVGFEHFAGNCLMTVSGILKEYDSGDSPLMALNKDILSVK